MNSFRVFAGTSSSPELSTAWLFFAATILRKLSRYYHCDYWLAWADQPGKNNTVFEHAEQPSLEDLLEEREQGFDPDGPMHIGDWQGMKWRNDTSS